MRTRNKWLLGGGLALCLGAAIAQTVIQNIVDMNSVVRVANGPGGPDAWVLVDTISNRTQFATTTQTGAATSTCNGGTLMWIGTAPTTWAVTLPAAGVANPGQQCTITTDTTLTSMVTVTAGTGNTLHATYNSQTLTALTPVTFQYQLSSLTWFRIK